MKIIILSDFAFVNGGGAQIALTTAVALAKKGYDVILFTAVGPIEPFLLNVKNLKVICLNQKDILSDNNRIRAIINGLWNFKARSELKKILLQFDKKNTIIHVHSCEKALSSSCIQIANKLGFKILYHLHDYGIACPNMGFYNYKKQKICTLKPLSLKCILSNCDSRKYIHKCWRVIRQWIQKNIGGIPKNTNYIYISKFSFNILKPFINRKKGAYFIPNPIDFEKKERVTVEKNNNILFVGRLTTEKNPVLLAKASYKLQLPVVFVGAGPCEEEIIKYNPNAILTGWLNRDKLENIMLSARCLVFPSNCYETQGLVVLEALSKGIPCISTNNCAASESITDKKNGLLFNNGDLLELENRLKMCEDDSFVRRMSINAYDSFWNMNYTIDRYVENILDAYRKILVGEDI